MWYVTRKDERQGSQLSFIGGKPVLPPEVVIPSCKLCGALQTFMFQIAFPAPSTWSGKNLAVFFCLECADEEHLIPEMLRNHGRGCDIPKNFLNDYQRNFSFLVFSGEKAGVLKNYDERVAFSSLEFVDKPSSADFGKIGGSPSWLLGDETPASYGLSTPMVFLMELSPGLAFSKVHGARPQIELDIFGNPAPSPLDFYQLFLGNAVYLFGTATGESLVYAITQV